MTANFVLRSFTANDARPFVERLIAVQQEIFADPEDPFTSEDRYRQQITSHMTASGWKLVTAMEGDDLVGYAYGFPLPPTTRWWQGLITPVPCDFTVEDGHRTFAVSEIMVRAPWRRRGVAQALHDALLADRPEQRATLLAEPGNAPAQAAYAKWGWRKVAELRPHWEHAPAFDVLTR